MRTFLVYKNVTETTYIRPEHIVALTGANGTLSTNVLLSNGLVVYVDKAPDIVFNDIEQHKQYNAQFTKHQGFVPAEAFSDPSSRVS